MEFQLLLPLAVMGYVLMTITLAIRKCLRRGDELALRRRIHLKRMSSRDPILDFGVSRSLAAGIADLDLDAVRDMLNLGAISAEMLTRIACLRARWAGDTHSAVADECFVDALLCARRRDAAAPAHRGPLHGIPISVKDGIDVHRMDSTCGHVHRTFQPAAKTAAIVNALEAAGAVVICKSNQSALPLSPYSSRNTIYGVATNPWAGDIPHSAGGSSGGAACLAAVRAGWIHIGSDAGGMLRSAAHFCGVCDFSPTVPPGGPDGLGAHNALLPMTAGFMAREIGDIQQVVRALEEPDVASTEEPHSVLKPDLTSPRPQHHTTLPIDQPSAKPDHEQHSVHTECHMMSSLSQEGPKRVGILRSDGWFEPHPAVSRALEEAAALLAKQGYQIVEFELPFDGEDIVPLVAALVTRDEWAILGDAMARDDGTATTTNPTSTAQCETEDEQNPSFALEETHPVNYLPALSILASLPSWLRRSLAWGIGQVLGLQRTAIILQGVNSGLHSGNQEHLLKRRQEMAGQLQHAMDGADIHAALIPPAGIPAGSARSGYTHSLLPAFVYSALCSVLGFPSGGVPVTRVSSSIDSWTGVPFDVYDRRARQATANSAGLPVGVSVFTRPHDDQLCLTVLSDIAAAANFSCEPPSMESFVSTWPGPLREAQKPGDKTPLLASEPQEWTDELTSSAMHTLRRMLRNTSDSTSSALMTLGRIARWGE